MFFKYTEKDFLKPFITGKDKKLFEYLLSNDKSSSLKFDVIYNKNYKNIKLNAFFCADNIFSDVPFFENHFGILKLSFTTVINFEKLAYL
jgi:hypothetical protein